ncbi:MAG TPA: hypothetical protein VF883_21290 [Thermoanaerobaculia bacterium]|jgi:hypothetical protein
MPAQVEAMLDEMAADVMECGGLGRRFSIRVRPAEMVRLGSSAPEYQSGG